MVVSNSIVGEIHYLIRFLFDGLGCCNDSQQKELL